MPRFYYEDFEEGSVERFGSRTVTREEIVGFAAEFDPQPMHLDEQAARRTPLGGLAASGWHSCAIMMRLIADGFILESSCMGSPGVEELKWLKPVRPGDRLNVCRTVLEKRASKSRPEMGFVRFRFELLNQNGETVMEQTNFIMFGRRAAETSR
jgi:acyl dehydratase